MSKVILTIDYQDYLIGSKGDAMAVVKALMGAVRVSWVGENNFRTTGAPTVEIKAAGHISIVKLPEPKPRPEPAAKPEPPAEKPAPKAAGLSAEDLLNPKERDAKLQVIPPAVAPARDEVQEVVLRPVSAKSASARLALMARTIESEGDCLALPAPTNSRPELPGANQPNLFGGAW